MRTARGDRDVVAKKAGLTAIFVTHDQVEAMAIADRVDPNSLFAADFMGINNSFKATVAEIQCGRVRFLDATPCPELAQIAPAGDLKSRASRRLLLISGWRVMAFAGAIVA